MTVSQPDRAGEVARLTQAIDQKGGYISVFVTYPSAKGAWTSVCKVKNVPQEDLDVILKGLHDAEIQDVREM
jgi:hypothetical protein